MNKHGLGEGGRREAEMWLVRTSWYFGNLGIMEIMERREEQTMEIYLINALV